MHTSRLRGIGRRQVLEDVRRRHRRRTTPSCVSQAKPHHDTALVQAGMPRRQATLRNERRRSCRYTRAIRGRGNPLGLGQSSRIERLMGLPGGATRTSPCCIVTYRKPCGEQFGRKPISYGTSFTASARWNQTRAHPAACLRSREFIAGCWWPTRSPQPDRPSSTCQQDSALQQETTTTRPPAHRILSSVTGAHA